MPLAVLSGFPSSGKSTRARDIAKQFEQRVGDKITAVYVVDDPSLGIKKNDYSDRDSEKQARGAQMAAVKRLLAPDTLVILDGLSYIKGFRYQLYTEARNLKDNSSVIFIGTPANLCREWNTRAEDPWPVDLFDELVYRYEEPNSLNRWDSPLFIIHPGDEVPIDEIWDSLVLRKPKPPNVAVSIKPAASQSYLQELNEKTSSLAKEIMERHRDAPGATVLIAGQSITLPYDLSIAQINRIRRNFVQLNKSAALISQSIPDFFLDFVAKNWDME